MSDRPQPTNGRLCDRIDHKPPLWREQTPVTDDRTQMILHGRLLDDPAEPPEYGWLAIADGRIVDRGEGSPGRARGALGSPDHIVCPGFIDAHTHPPQIDSIGHAGLELLVWLEQVIYPAEQRWADADFAAGQAFRFYRQLLKEGTLGFAGFLTSHLSAMEDLCHAASQIPLRTIAGQILMDRRVPSALCTTAIDDAPIDRETRIERSINPRFAPACSEALLAAAGASARSGAIVQTHLAETLAECEQVRALFPAQAHYTAVYDTHGLLSSRTLLAHCLHLSDEEWQLIAARDAVVVHCPTANQFLQSGLFNLGRARHFDIRLALGSDVAAGPDLSMPRVGRAMIEVAKARRAMGEKHAVIPGAEEVWRLITRGNAQALGWEDAGHLHTGAAADLLVLRSPPGEDRRLVEHWLETWTSEYIEHRIVAGHLADALLGDQQP